MGNDHSSIARWASERLEASAGRVSAADLYADYRAWSIAQPVYVHSLNAMGRELKRLGYLRHRSNGKRYVLGVALRPAEVI